MSEQMNASTAQKMDTGTTSSKRKRGKKSKHKTRYRQHLRQRKRQSVLRIGTHNVQTGHEAADLEGLCDLWAARPTVDGNLIVGEEAMDMDIVLIQELRLSDTTSPTTNCGEYQVWWTNNNATPGKDNVVEKDLGGVGIAIRHEVHASLGGGIPTFVNDRIVRFDGVHQERKMTFIGGYAPTNTDDNDDAATAFFSRLQNTINNVPQDHMLVMGGDMNAWMPNTGAAWAVLPGPLATNVEPNRNGLLLAQLAVDEDLMLLNSCFVKNNYGTYKTKNNNGESVENDVTIDHLWTKRSQRRYVDNTQVHDHCGLSDHHAVVSTVSFATKRPQKKKNRPKKPARIPANDGSTNCNAKRGGDSSAD
jgi:exonuclease III